MHLIGAKGEGTRSIALDIMTRPRDKKVTDLAALTGLLRQQSHMYDTVKMNRYGVKHKRIVILAQDDATLHEPVHTSVLNYEQRRTPIKQYNMGLACHLDSC